MKFVDEGQLLLPGHGAIVEKQDRFVLTISHRARCFEGERKDPIIIASGQGVGRACHLQQTNKEAHFFKGTVVGMVAVLAVSVHDKEI